LKLDDDDGTPKFGDKDKHMTTFPDLSKTPQEPKRKVTA
jgi:hypothetical protein